MSEEREPHWPVSHVPLQMIEENMANQLEWCHEAPFYTLALLTADIASSHRYLASPD